VIVPLAPGEAAWLGLLESIPASFELLASGPERPAGLPSRCQWVDAPLGRARQMNEAARRAGGRHLWFLHADTRLGPRSVEALERSLRAAPDALHWFDLEFLPDGPPWMRLNAWGAGFRSRVLGMPFGDQGLCVLKARFLELGGFPEGAAYGEDHLFVWRARARGVRLNRVGAPLRTSARRYRERGWLRATAWTMAATARQAVPQALALLRARAASAGRAKEGFGR
jgi:hypothetical protein